MRQHDRWMWRAVGAALVLGTLLVTSGPVMAHSLKVWARVAEGATITGRAYFPGGGRARGVTVQVFGPGEQSLGSVTTDDQGEFTYTATARCDHTFVVNTGDGHRDERTIPAEQLPDTLPTLGDEAETGAPSPPAATDVASPTEVFVAPPGKSGELRHMVDRAVARHVGPLQDQIAEYESYRRLHDIIGGIGYIVGVTGIVFYFKSGRGGTGRPAKTDDRD